MDTEHVSLAHGNGGRYMRELIDELFARRFANDDLDTSLDAATLKLNTGEILFTTDGFTVQPLEFPGGNIGSLAIHGTVNDLAVAGALPLYLSLNVFAEEGLPISQLERIVSSMAAAAKEAEVAIVAGDTKVLPRGEGGGLYLATTGIGTRLPGIRPAMSLIQPGDAVLISGPVGDHGTAVMLAREEFGLRGDLKSDSASVLPLTRALLDLRGLRFMRDPTRGGIATVAHDIARHTGYGLRLSVSAIPVHDAVRAVCEMLGYDPYYLACEGRVLAVISDAQAATALQRWHKLPGGKDAARIGTVVSNSKHVVLETEIGGERFLEELEDDPLPRIC